MSGEYEMQIMQNLDNNAWRLQRSSVYKKENNMV